MTKRFGFQAFFFADFFANKGEMIGGAARLVFSDTVDLCQSEARTFIRIT